jgi:cytochrome d ubiquinol oxidase subunit I
MEDALTVHRIQFAFTVAYHYLFPQLTMGLALLIVLFQARAWRRNDERAGRAAAFWARIFALNFGMGVVTGIPLEFQFGTNWARFSERTGGLIGQLLAMEGTFSFFLESTFLGLFLFGGKRLSKGAHFATAVLVFLGSWLSGLFIVAVNAWMQHPVGHAVDPDGTVRLESFSALFTNPWLFWQYAHTMTGAVLTGATVVAAVGAFYVLAGRHEHDGRTFLALAVPVGAVAAVLAAFPTGDAQGTLVAEHQGATLAAMEGLFETQEGAPIVLIGQPDMERRALDNPIEIPRALSFLTHRRWKAEIRGLDAFPEDEWPDNVPLLYYAYHVMVGIGTILIAVFGFAAFRLLRGRLASSRGTLFLLLLTTPLPYIANTAGWLTAELGRQPWIVHGLIRTADGSSTNVSAGNALFSLIGFMGLYLALGILFLFLAAREIEKGPAGAGEGGGH